MALLADQLAEKIHTLSTDQLSRVELYIQVLERESDDDRALVAGFAKLSEPSFARIWDNPEDAIYDDL